MTTLQKSLIAITLVAAVGAGIYEARKASQLREQNQTLLQQQAPLAEQIQRRPRNRAVSDLTLQSFVRLGLKPPDSFNRC